jgi:hypothetical protein
MPPTSTTIKLTTTASQSAPTETTKSNNKPTSTTVAKPVTGTPVRDMTSSFKNNPESAIGLPTTESNEMPKNHTEVYYMTPLIGINEYLNMRREEKKELKDVSDGFRNSLHRAKEVYSKGDVEYTVFQLKELIQLDPAFIDARKLLREAEKKKSANLKGFAKIIADELEYDFYSFDGSSLKVEEIRKVIKRYENSLIKPLSNFSFRYKKIIINSNFLIIILFYR